MDDDEDEQLKLALALSMAEAQGGQPAQAGQGGGVPGDSSYVANVLASLPGVDAADPALREAAERAAGAGQPGEDKKDDVKKEGE
jgi:hypothetical protein